MTADRRDEEGFASLEAIVAFTILALALVMASQSIVAASRDIRQARQQVDGLRNARERLAALRLNRSALSLPDRTVPATGNDAEIRPVHENGLKLAAVRIPLGGGEFIVTFIERARQQP